MTVIDAETYLLFAHEPHFGPPHSQSINSLRHNDAVPELAQLPVTERSDSAANYSAVLGHCAPVHLPAPE
jgi:hypothetical protein